ncbi:MAG: V-type ATP synthase subunit D [Parachlamydiales bacterium]|nr:V-type ATP synthase subunit D [Parachlamydiales bacterium]
MAKIKLTKMALRAEQRKLQQLLMYLPTLKLKKSLLQLEVISSKATIAKLLHFLSQQEKELLAFSDLLVEKYEGDYLRYAEVSLVSKEYENIAGVEIPLFRGVVFHEKNYSFMDTPPWLDFAIERTRKFITEREKINVEEEKKRALEHELKEVSIRVNLFEKILIPRTRENIRQIVIFLGDQQLAAVSQAKVAKRKMMMRKEQIL